MPAQPPTDTGRSSAPAWVSLIVLLSCLLAAVALHELTAAELPQLRSWPLALGSVAILCGGFLAQGRAWAATLRAGGIAVDVRAATISCALTTFAKYVPGKVLTIVARAAYLSTTRGLPMARLSSLSLAAQLMALWAAILVGMPVLLVTTAGTGWLAVTLLSWLAITALMFLPWRRHLVSAVLQLAGRNLPELAWPPAARIMGALPWHVLQWLLMALGFGLLANALLDVSIALGFALPLAMAFGILVLPAPGGLGAADGALASIFFLAGYPLEDCAMIAVSTRLWLLIGELLFFSGGVAASRWLAVPARPGGNGR